MVKKIRCGILFLILMCALTPLAAQADAAGDNLATLRSASVLQKKNAPHLPSLGSEAAMKGVPRGLSDYQTDLITRPYHGTHTYAITERVAVGVSRDDTGRSAGFTYTGDGYKIHVGGYRNYLVPEHSKQLKTGVFVQIPF